MIIQDILVVNMYDKSTMIGYWNFIKCFIHMIIPRTSLDKISFIVLGGVCKDN